MKTDYNENIKNQDSNNIVFSFSNHYYRGKKYTLTAYFPVFSSQHVGEINGTIVMNLDDNILTQLQKKRKFLILRCISRIWRDGLFRETKRKKVQIR
mgnify:CR=1 FL=1